MAAAPPRAPTDPLVAAVRASGVVAAGARILVAVSGGRDSTALACLLEALRAEADLTLVLGHVDHGWRGAAEAAADRAAVEALGARLGLPVVVTGPPPADTPHTEDAARRVRYRALGALAREHGLTTIATGHHAGDQAETVLMRLLRGSGPHGLAGIPARRTLEPGGLVVVRPLLALEPEALADWLRAHDVPWREDPTNADPRHDRVRVRARLAARPQGRRSLVALAGRMRRRIAARTARIEQVAAGAFVHDARAAAVSMPRAALRTLQGEDLALALRRAGEPLAADRDGPWLTRRLVDRAAACLTAGGALDLPHGLRLHVRGTAAWLYRPEGPVPPPPALVREDADAAAFDLDAWRAGRHAREAALDAGTLGSGAHLRAPAAGDVFAPHGGSGRPVAVHAWLARQGVPGFVRRGVLVLDDGRGGVAWVVGRRVDAAHAVTPQTRRVARVRPAT